MFMRRRPLLRAAAIGGGAYVMGKRAGQRADQQQDGTQSQQSQQAQQEAPAPAAAQASIPDQLNRLSALHDQGALTDAEFASAKAKLLGS
jgi:membrane protease subunit (stomatin/prohibitin family)